MDNKKIYIGIFAIIILICVLSPYLASNNPDGLESSVEHLNPTVMNSNQIINPIMKDYTINSLGDNPIIGVGCLIIGAIISIGIAYGFFHIIINKD